MKIKSICKYHPKYQAKRQPRVPCSKCWEAYIRRAVASKQGIIELVEIVNQLHQDSVDFSHQCAKIESAADRWWDE